MKTLRPLLFAALLGSVLLSCDSSGDVIPDITMLPELRTFMDGTTEIEYDEAKSRITGVQYKNYYPNNVVLSSRIDYHYRVDGKLIRTERHNDKIVVTMNFIYDGGRIMRTDEVWDNVLIQYFTFSYDDRGLLKEYIQWQNIPEEGGNVPIVKNTFEYDQRGNLTGQKHYYGVKNEFHLLSVFTFSDYDDKVATDNLFQHLYFNPSVRLSRNNPGITTSANAAGLGKVTGEFTYTYNEHGYVTKSSLVQTDSDGEKFTNEATYTFKSNP
jgi:hypothetical protein